MHTLQFPLQRNPGSISDSRGKAFYPSFFCLFFWLSLVLLTFTKLLKVSISLLRKLNVRIIVYLNDMFLMASSLQDLLMAKDTLMYILQHLGFLINIRKLYLEPTSTLEFLGVIVDSEEMILSLPKCKFSNCRINAMKSKKRRK